MIGEARPDEPSGMDDRPQISVVIPARNAAATLPLQIDAVLSQQTEQWSFEVLVVDNGSTDGTGALLADRARRDPRLRTVMEGRPGSNIARNTGILAARADRIVLCDADDVVEDCWLAALDRNLMGRSYVGGAISRGACNGPDGRRRWGIREPIKPVVIVNRRTGFPSPMSANCAFFKTMWEEVDGFDERLSGAHDEVEFFSRAADKGWSMVESPDAVVQYRLPDSSTDAFTKGYRYGHHTARVLRTIGPRRGDSQAAPGASKAERVLRVSSARLLQLGKLMRSILLLARASVTGRGTASHAAEIGRWIGHLRGSMSGPLPGQRQGVSNRSAQQSPGGRASSRSQSAAQHSLGVEPRHP